MTKICRAAIVPIFTVMTIAPSTTSLAASNCPSGMPDFPDGSIVTRIAGQWVVAKKSLEAVTDQTGSVTLTYVVNRPSAAEGAVVVKVVSARENSQGGKIKVERGAWRSTCLNPNDGMFSEAIDGRSWLGFHRSKESDADLERSGDKAILRFHRKYANKKGRAGHENCVWTASNGRGNRKQFILSQERERGFWSGVATASRTLFSIDEAIAATGLDSTVKMYHYSADESGAACVTISLSRFDWANRITVNDLERKGRSVATLGLLRHLGDKNIPE